MTNREIGRGTVVVDGEKYATDTFEFDGELLTIRELSVDEGDDAWDASQEPVNAKDPEGAKRFNNRTNTRLLLAAAMVEPKTTPDQIGKWGNRRFTIVLRRYNNLNSIDDAKPTLPAGSAEPTPPDGGESSPET